MITGMVTTVPTPPLTGVEDNISCTTTTPSVRAGPEVTTHGFVLPGSWVSVKVRYLLSLLG